MYLYSKNSVSINGISPYFGINYSSSLLSLVFPLQPTKLCITYKLLDIPQPHLCSCFHYLWCQLCSLSDFSSLKLSSVHSLAFTFTSSYKWWSISCSSIPLIELKFDYLLQAFLTFYKPYLWKMHREGNYMLKSNKKPICLWKKGIWYLKGVERKHTRIGADKNVKVLHWTVVLCSHYLASVRIFRAETKGQWAGRWSWQSWLLRIAIGWASCRPQQASHLRWRLKEVILRGELMDVRSTIEVDIGSYVSHLMLHFSYPCQFCCLLEWKTSSPFPNALSHLL